MNKQHGGKFAGFGFSFPLLPFLRQWLIAALLLVRDTPDNRLARFQPRLIFFVAAQCKWNMSHISSDSLTDTATWDFVSQTQNMQAYAWLGIQNTKTKDALQLKRYVSIQSQRQWPSTLRFKTSFEIVRLFYTHNGYTSLKRLRSKHHCRAYSNSFRGFYYFIFYFPRLNYIAKWKSCDHWLLCKDVVIPRQMSPLS